jgi:7-cyano-7-deazaguanine synthase
MDGSENRSEKGSSSAFRGAGLDDLPGHSQGRGVRGLRPVLPYSQRHAVELEAARQVAQALGAAEHLVLDVPMDRIGGSALTSTLEVPKDTPLEEMGSRIPVTYVPARNTVFLSLALAWAEVLGSGDIFIGVNAMDYSGYPDCRPEFITAFETMANLATRAGVEGTSRFKVHAPLMRMTKEQIIRRGVQLGLDYSMTHSCYDPSSDGLACGRCESCRLRSKGFADAGVADPTRYSGTVPL